MGTELNYFHIVDGEEFRFADRKSSPPSSFHEIGNGYNYFKQFIDTECAHKHQFYDLAQGEFIVDSDNKILLFYIAYTELAGDSIKTAAALVKKAQLAWPEWSVYWACGGKAETRFYLECLSHDRVAFSASSYQYKDYFFEILRQAANQYSVDNENPASQPCALDTLKTQFFEIIELGKEKYGDEWERVIASELYDVMLPSIKTTLLYVSKSHRFKYLHFIDDMSHLLFCKNLLTYCRESDTYLESDYFSEELRWGLSFDPNGGSIVIDEANHQLVVVPPPCESRFQNCVNVAMGIPWCGWDISFDLPMLYAYHLEARERS